VTLALAVAACGEDDGEEAPSTTSPPTETGTTEAPTSSTSDTGTAEAPTSPTSEPAPLLAEHICPYVPTVVLVKNPSDADLALPEGVDERQPDELPGILGYEEDFPADINVGAALTDMFEAGQMTAYEVTGGFDSLDRALEFESLNADIPDLVASPLLLLTLTGHWSMSPADEPTATGDPGSAPSEPFLSQATVAVVDTGYKEDGDTMQWLSDRVDGVNSTFDEEQSPPTIPGNVAGHGKFVSSVIVQEAPNAAVRVARLGAFDPSLVPPNLQNVFTTDELQLYIAIRRLLQLQIPYSALNLSLGAYACENLGDPVVDNSGLAIREAVDLWTDTSEGAAPIFAAAGNHDPNDSSPLPPFLPAAYDTGPNDSIYSVMSLDGAGNRSDFSNDALCGAWGEDVVGVGGDPAGDTGPGDDWVRWSGSSFATALLTARAIVDAEPSCGPFTTPDNVVTLPPASAPPTTPGPTAPESTATTTTRPPTSPTTTTLG
jgi:Subtilase family